MKKLLITLCIFYILSVNITGQIKNSIPSPEEEREAKALAVSFFTRFQETQDITPLIKEFFVKDFATRLKFCGTTNECGGFARDFWGKREELIAINATEVDFQRSYSLSINILFLEMRCVTYSNGNIDRKIDEIDGKTTEKVIKNDLKVLLKDNSKLLKFGAFSEETDEYKPLKFKTLDKFHQYLNDGEKYLSVLKTYESKLRADLQKQQPSINFSKSSIDFSVNSEENSRQFFNYPVGTKMLFVFSTPFDFCFAFKMDFIKEAGKLKIVAIYIPMD